MKSVLVDREQAGGQVDGDQGGAVGEGAGSDGDEAGRHAAAGKATRAKEEQPAKASSPMETRPAGRLMAAREEQWRKAPSPMETRPAREGDRDERGACETRVSVQAVETRERRCGSRGRCVMPSGSTACPSVTMTCQPSSSSTTSQPGGGAAPLGGGDD